MSYLDVLPQIQNTTRCGEPPAGQARWTLRLLADKAVELEIVPAISHETVRQVLKKTNSNVSVSSVFIHK